MNAYQTVCGICLKNVSGVLWGGLNTIRFQAAPVILKRQYSNCPDGMKVTICGAAGATGQPLSLLLKQCPQIDELALYDVISTCGYGMELSHVDTKCKVTSYSGRHMLCNALQGSKVVVIVAREQDDKFENNAPIIADIALEICNICPKTFTIVGTEPVASLVPVIGEIQRLRALYDPRKLLGCVELNCVRANTVVADFLGVPPESVRVPVVGGATPETMVPLISAAIHPGAMTQEQVECVTSCITSGTEAVCAAMSSCAATPSLAGAFALARTTTNVVKSMGGQKIVQCAFFDSMGTCVPDCQYFACDAVLGASGIEKNLGLPDLSKFENCLLRKCLPLIRSEIDRGVALVKAMCKRSAPPPPTDLCTTPPIIPCAPPGGWSASEPNECRDTHLASICHDFIN